MTGLNCHPGPQSVRGYGPVNNRVLSLRLADVRGHLVAVLGDADIWRGRRVPEDPGIAAGALGHLRAAARLGGLLPAVTLWHLHRAVRREQAARDGTQARQA